MSAAMDAAYKAGLARISSAGLDAKSGQACADAFTRIYKSINAKGGQHLRAIRKGFSEAGSPVTATVSVPAQRRSPLVSEGTISARNINRFASAPTCAASGCNGPTEGQCLGICTGGMA